MESSSAFFTMYRPAPVHAHCPTPTALLQVALRPAALPKDAPSNFKGRLVSLECLSSLLPQLRELRVLPAT